MYVTTAGYSHIPPGTIEYPPTRHPSAYHFAWKTGRVLDEYQIVYITSGSGQFETNTLKTRVEPGTVIFLSPGLWHRYRASQKTGWNEYWVGLSGEVIGWLAKKGFFPIDQPIAKIGVSDEIIDQYMRLIRDAETQPVGYQQAIASRGMLILAAILADIKQAKVGGSNIEELVQKTKELLNERINEDVDMDELAEKLDVSYQQLRRAFKQVTNLAPHQYHLEIRISRAKELLRGTEQPIKAISTTLGFANQYYFSRIFKNKTGKSPIEWRNAGK